MSLVCEMAGVGPLKLTFYNKTRAKTTLSRRAVPSVVRLFGGEARHWIGLIAIPAPSSAEASYEVPENDVNSKCR